MTPSRPPPPSAPANQREAAKQATQQAVLAEARNAFDELGFERANLREIAARAGVSAPTVLHYYGDKRGLLHAALYEDLETALSDAIEAARRKRSLDTQLGALTAAMFGFYEARPALSRVALKESLFADPPWAQRFAAQTERASHAVAALAARARERGELAPDCDPTLLSVTYLSIFYFALIAWVQRTVSDPTALVAHQVNQLLRNHSPKRRDP